jgi:hypothetical protein
MRTAHFSVAESHGRCPLQLWSEEPNPVRTVVGLRLHGLQFAPARQVAADRSCARVSEITFSADAYEAPLSERRRSSGS